MTAICTISTEWDEAPCPATTSDVSKGGMRLRISQENNISVIPGDLLSIKFDSVIVKSSGGILIAAKVAHYSYEEDGELILGIEIIPENSPIEDWYKFIGEA